MLLSCEWGWGVFAADFSVTAEVGQELGADAFDANKTMKYTVDVTNGNLYVKQTDMVIPSQRGPSIEVIRTYNSRSFDFPRMFGDANWSCSLRKYLKPIFYSSKHEYVDYERVMETQKVFGTTLRKVGVCRCYSSRIVGGTATPTARNTAPAQPLS